MTGDGSELGVVLRRLRLRRGLTQRQLAVLAGTGVSHLSRLESGDRTDVSRTLLARLGEALGATHELAAAARRLPYATEQALLRYPRALDRDVLDSRTLPALRRSDAAARAEALLNRTPGVEQHGRIDPLVLCRRLGLTPETRVGDGGPPVEFLADAPRRGVVIRAPGEPGEPSVLPRTRFLAAHAAAHAMAGEAACSLPMMADAELEACDIAVHLLVPKRLLNDTLAKAGLERIDVWSPDLGVLMFSVADRLAVPGWVAVRRVADEQLLDDQALYFSSGGDEL